MAIIAYPGQGTTAAGAPVVATGGALPFMGPYQANTNLAHLAYQNALNQLNTQYGQTLQQYGFMPTASGFSVDPNNQYGAYQQMLKASAGESMAADHASQARGFDPNSGLGAQAGDQARYDAGARSLALGQGMTGAMSAINQAKAQAQFQYQQAVLRNRLAQIEAAIKARAFNVAKARRA